MKTSWHYALLVALGVGASGAFVEAQGPERTGTRTVAARQAQPAGDAIRANQCFINMIDKITVAAGRSGVLAYVKPEEGHIVKTGEEVAKVKDEVAAAQFATASKQADNDIEIRFAQKSAEVAQAEYMKGMQANLLLVGTVTDIEIKRLKLAYERAVLQMENAQKEHEIAGSKRDEAGELLQTHVIETPIGGTVTKVYKKSGEGVREGDPIIELVNTDRMRVSGYIPLTEISRVRLGDRVTVNLDIPKVDLPEEEIRFEGKITFIDVAINRVNEPQVKVFAEITNQGGVLRDGATAAMVVFPRKGLPQNATTQRDNPRLPVMGQE